MRGWEFFWTGNRGRTFQGEEWVGGVIPPMKELLDERF